MSSMHENEIKLLSRWVPRSAKTLTVLALGVAFVNSATMGYDSSMMNGLNILPQYNEYFNLNTATIGLNNAAIWIGSVIGAAFIQPAADRLGRKWALFIASCLCILGAAIQSAAHNIATFVIGRVFIGLGSELASGPGPALIAETVKTQHRGVLLGLYWTFYNVGSLFSAAINLGMVNIGTTWSWRVPSILQVLPSILSLAVLIFVPESPRWLVSKGRIDEAREILAIIHGDNNVNDERTHFVLNEVVQAIRHEKEQYPVHPWKELVASKANIRRLVIILSFGVMIQMMGNFVISYYLGAMLTQAGITSAKTKLQINTILSCWSLVLAVGGSFIVDVIGRKPLGLLGVGGMIVSLFIFGGLAKVYGNGGNTSGVYGTVAMIFIFKGFYAGSFTPLNTIYSTEVVSYRIRAAGLSLFRLVTSGFGLLASFAMSYAMADLGWKFYMINASWDILFLLIIYFVWIETRGLTLEEIAIKFGDLDQETLTIDGITSEGAELEKSRVAVKETSV